jgi:GNAT superfamily N-acetyltransferase
VSAPAVRPMRLEDAAAVARLSGQLGYPVDREEIQDRLRRLSESPDAAVFVAGGPGGDVFGWIHVAAPRDLVSARYAEVRALVVDEAHRGQGIGKALLQAAEAWARERLFDSIRVRSNTARERTRGFYEREGYAVTKTQYNFHKPLSADRP